MPRLFRCVLTSLVFSACAADAVPPLDERDQRDDRGTGEAVEQVGRVSGRVSGLSANTPARVILGNDSFLDSTAVVDGRFELRNVPDGTYFAKLDVAGYATSATQPVIVRDGAGNIELVATALDDDAFAFAWAEDESRGGHEHSSDIAPHSAAAQNLLDHYNIALSDAEQPWTQEHAARLLRMMRAVPQQVRSVSQRYWLQPSTWTLSAGPADDLVVARATRGNTVRISADAFSDTDPQMIALEGQRDAYFAKRLHRAVVRYVTHDGTASAAVERILAQRYGVTTSVADYSVLTASTTRETATSFQAFPPSELVDLISMFEEMPTGFHAVAGLTTVVRRADAGESPVRAWTTAGYLELTDAAFAGSREDSHQAMVREKARFIVTPTLEAGWSALGITEPLPEMIAEYMGAPDVVRDRSLAGFELIRDQIMQGGLTLDPAATWAGQVVSVAIRAVDQPDVGKRIVVELGLRTDATLFTGASSAAIRLYSESGSTAIVMLSPLTESGSVVRGELVLRAPIDAGFWRPDQIVVRDSSGKPLVHSVFDVGWKLFID